MGEIFGACYRVLKRDGRFIFTYHHWNPESWAAITVGLKRAGFVLVNRYVVHSENPFSLHIAGFKALTDDVILVLAPKGAVPDVLWERPNKVNTAESAAFCHDCGTLLGWLLTAEVAEREVNIIWQEMITPI
jgi:adenine-specific DNA methylase